MQISEIGSSVVPSTGGSNTFSREDFMKILTEQLKSQNPLEPMESEAFINQLVAINNLEQINVLASSLTSFQSKMSLLFGVEFIGKQIEGLSEDGTKIEGKVESVLQDKDGVFLKVSNKYVPVDSVSVVKEVENGVNQGS
ncbi:MAG: hypothetical protein HY606_11155 [Planctomycetes bacterium]|nr:hypothetical protein [Planctomycetota bacterium]